jgi:hypothetical protein
VRNPEVVPAAAAATFANHIAAEVAVKSLVFSPIKSTMEKPMRNLILAGAAAIIALGGITGLAQAAAGQQASPVQIQANPTGPGTPSMTPPDPATADSPVPPAMPADPNYHAGPYVGALTPPPPEAMSKVYPRCSRKLQDNCTNLR